VHERGGEERRFEIEAEALDQVDQTRDREGDDRSS
jgi:hypothetical protein